MYFSLLNLFNLATKSHKDGELFVPSPDLPGEQAQRIEGSLERREEGKSREGFERIALGDRASDLLRVQPS